MSFEKKRTNFGVLMTKNEIGDELLGKVVAQAYSETVPTSHEGPPVFDFTAGTSIADVAHEEGDDEFLTFGGIPYFSLRQKKMKIDSNMLKERLEQAYHEEHVRNDFGPISRKRRKEIRETVILQMSSESRLTYSGQRLAVLPRNKLMLVESTSLKKLGDTADILRALTGFEASIFGPLSLYTLKTKEPPTSYVGFKDEDCTKMGTDFMTWLWMISDLIADNDEAGLNGVDQKMAEKGINLCLTGNLTLCDAETETGAKIIKLSKGTPALAREARVALDLGKRVTSADFELNISDRNFSVTIEDGFIFKGVKVGTTKKEKKLAVPDRFMTKMNHILDLIVGIGMLSGMFIEYMTDNKHARETFARWAG